MSVADKFNPLTHTNSDQYLVFWTHLFNTLFNGFWARAMAVTFFLLAIWFGVRRQHMPLGALFLVLALIVAYIAPLLRFSGLM